MARPKATKKKVRTYNEVEFTKQDLIELIAETYGWDVENTTIVKADVKHPVMQDGRGGCPVRDVISEVYIKFMEDK